MLSPYGKPQTTLIMVVALATLIGCGVAEWWIAAGICVLVAVILLAFFRDPNRRIPQVRGHAVSPADGRISSIHDVDHYPAFNGPAKCIRIFLSVLDVHVNRSAMHGRVVSKTHVPGEYLNALKAESAERNESVTIVLHHPTHDTPICAIRQVAGAIARRIVCGAEINDILQRGQRFGLIKFGSTTELYLPNPDRVEVRVREGQYVWGGATTLAIVSTLHTVEPTHEKTETKTSAVSQSQHVETI